MLAVLAWVALNYSCKDARIIFTYKEYSILPQDSGGMLSLLGMIEQCLKAGKKQSWHAASVTNICVGLLAGLKVLIVLCHLLQACCKKFFTMANLLSIIKLPQALLALRPQPLGSDILNSAQAIFLVLSSS